MLASFTRSMLARAVDFDFPALLRAASGMARANAARTERTQFILLRDIRWFLLRSDPPLVLLRRTSQRIESRNMRSLPGINHCAQKFRDSIRLRTPPPTFEHCPVSIAST